MTSREADNSQAIQDSAVAWRLAVEAYQRDDILLAYDLARPHVGAHGGQMLNFWHSIEAEWRTRMALRMASVAADITVEWPADLEPDPVDLEQVREAREDVAERFGWQPSAPLTICLLDPRLDVRWFPYRGGYYTNRGSHHKIVLPGGLLGYDEFGRALSHEIAHSMVEERAGGLCPIWLNEAVAQVADRTSTRGARRRFQSHLWTWLEPRELDQAFGANRLDDPSQRVLRAYMQACLIGQWLVRRGPNPGERQLGATLDAFTDNGLWKDLWLRIRGFTAADEAIRQVFGLGEDELFRLARPADGTSAEDEG